MRWKTEEPGGREEGVYTVDYVCKDIRNVIICFLFLEVS